MCLQMRALCRACQAAERPSRRQALTHTLLLWAGERRAWQQVMQLPFDEAEEQVRRLTCLHLKHAWRQACKCHAAAK